MAIISIISSSSIDGRRHEFEVPDEFVKRRTCLLKSNIIYDKEYLVLEKDGLHLVLEWNEGVYLDAINTNNQAGRSYYYRDVSYVDGQTYWSERSFKETNGVQERLIGIHYRKARRTLEIDGNRIIKDSLLDKQKIWTRKHEGDGPWLEYGIEDFISKNEIEIYEAALTQQHCVQHLIDFVLDSFEEAIPGITRFLMHDKYMRQLQRLRRKSVPTDYETAINSRFYEYYDEDFEACNQMFEPGAYPKAFK